jgi:hypothetical protein
MFPLSYRESVVLSKYSDKVIGAGEFWMSRSGDLKVNGNSGSYIPGTDMIKAIVEVFRLVFPGIEIHYTPISERPGDEVEPAEGRSSDLESEATLSDGADEVKAENEEKIVKVRSM